VKPEQDPRGLVSVRQDGAPTLNTFVVFQLDQQRYALRLGTVKRAIPAVEITPLPQAPDTVLGIINMHGQIIPVFNLRRRFHLPEREIEVNDKLIIAATARRIVALAVDSVGDVIEHAEQEVIDAGTVLPLMEYVEGIMKLADGMVLIHNLDTFLSLNEEEALEEAIREQRGEEDSISGSDMVREEQSE
jgi:purine-binding chemotaxis protein CheW